MRRHRIIQQKRLVLVGCEGSSEVSYAALLQEIVKDSDLPVALKIEELSPGAGDAFSRVQLLVKKIDHHNKRGSRFSGDDRFAFLDFSQPANGQDRVQAAEGLANQHSVSIVWQRPCFEANLLRHFDGQINREIAGTEAAMTELRRHWPSYSKPMSKAQLLQKINRKQIVRLATVEQNLGRLLHRLRLM